MKTKFFGFRSVFYLPVAIVVVFTLFSFASSTTVNSALLTSRRLNLTRISESTPAVHTLTFVAVSGVAAGENITVTYPTGFTIGGTFDYLDVTFEEGDSSNCLTATYTPKTLGATPSGSTWGFSVSGQDLILTSGTGTVTANRCVRIVFQDNGTSNQITNPSVSSDQVYNVTITSGASDNGQVAVVILNDPSTPDGDQIRIQGRVVTTIILDIDTVLTDCENSTEVGVASVNLGTLAPGVVNKSNSTSTNFICLDIGTNASNGIKIYVQSNRSNVAGGLVSGSNAIASVTADLNLVATTEGYGLRVSSVGTPSLGSFSAVSPFNSLTSGSVGLVPGTLASSAQLVSSTAASRTGVSSRVAIEVAVKSSTSTPAGSYSDVLTFTALVNL